MHACTCAPHAVGDGGVQDQIRLLHGGVFGQSLCRLYLASWLALE